jgi:hypothetical protein
MKITKRQLRRIIKEEKRKLIRELGPPSGVGDVKGVLYDVLIPALKAEGIQGPAIIQTLRAAADLFEDEMREMLG